MVTEIRHIGLTVQNFELCKNFFINDLGFSVHKEMDEQGSYIDNMFGLSDVRVKTSKLKAPDGNLVELLKFSNHKVENDNFWSGKLYSTGLTHIALTVKNIQKTYDELLKKGYEFNAPPQNSPDGFAKVTFFKGPENLFVEIVEIL